MKLSTKGRYGLRALIDLGTHSNGGHLSLTSIAQRQSISEIYLEQVFSTLRKAGIVKSVKGAQGGYLLVEAPRRITVGMILRILEGDLTVIDEQATVGLEELSISNCVKINVWDKIDDRVNKLVDSITLEDLIEQQKRLNGENEEMFYI